VTTFYVLFAMTMGNHHLLRNRRTVSRALKVKDINALYTHLSPSPANVVYYPHNTYTLSSFTIYV